MVSFLDWNAVETNVDGLVKESSEPFDPNTIANARDLLNVCRIHSPLPSSVAKGYWSTVTLSWPEFQIEIFEDRFEVYHFNHKSIEIWHEDHRPREGFSKKFLSELQKLTTRTE